LGKFRSDKKFFLNRKELIVMKLKTSNLFGTFFWCLFTGIIVISIGFGAIFPSLNLIAKPLVCPEGTMNLDRQNYNPYPGKSVTTITWYCANGSSGTQTELGAFPMVLYAGTIYGVALFVVVLLGMLLTANKNQRPSQGDVTVSTGRFKPSEDTLSRMKELKDLRAANLISESEYEEKRAEILKSI
jgi:hypothetical protein